MYSYGQRVSMMRKTIAEFIFQLASFLVSALSGTEKLQLVVQRPRHAGKRASLSSISHVKKQSLKKNTKKRKAKVDGQSRQKRQRLPDDVGNDELIVGLGNNHSEINDAIENEARNERDQEPDDVFGGDWTQVKREKRLARSNSKKFLMHVERLRADGVVCYKEELRKDDLNMCRYCKHIRPPVDYDHPLYSPNGDILCPKFGACFICNSKSHTPKYCAYNPVLRGLVAKIYEAGPGSLNDSIVKEIRRLLPTSVPCRFCLTRHQNAFSHSMQNEAGDVVCPVLSSLACYHCGATGAAAHTAKYCPYRPPQRANLSLNVDAGTERGRQALSPS